MKLNPPWVDQVLRAAAADVSATPQWLPIDGGSELGCGKYGCVVPTVNPDVVLKITTDDTEAQFAATLAGSLAAPICVRYHRVVETTIQHEGKTIYLLWRDVAYDVGRVRETLGDLAGNHLDRQHEAAQQAYWAAFTQQPMPLLRELLAQWVADIRNMARSKRFPAIRRFGAGLVEVWERQRILFGDVHEGNVGFRDGEIVIIDPGHIAVVGPDVMSGESH